MNYKKIYNNLIIKRKNISVIGYKEKHHIIPKCIGGSNDRDNLVNLTAREHYMAHALLCKIYPDNISICFAFNCMCFKWGSRDKRSGRHYRVNSYIYESCRKKLSEFMRKLKTGVPNTEEQKRKISQTLKRKYASGEKGVVPLYGVRNGMYGKRVSEKVSKAVAEANRRRVWTKEMRQKGRRRGKDHPLYGKKRSPEWNYKCVITKCYNRLLKYNSSFINPDEWDIYSGKGLLPYKSVIKWFDTFENMVKIVNEKYNTNYQIYSPQEDQEGVLN